MTERAREIATILSKRRNDIFELWNKQLIIEAKSMVELIGLDEIRSRTRDMLTFFIDVLPEKEDETHESYQRINDLLADLSSKMTIENMTPSETAAFVFSMKDAIFPVLQDHFEDKSFAEAIILVNQLIDQLGLNTFEVYLDSREDVITEQQKAFQEVSVPVVKIWDRIIMIPLVGMLDSERTQLMMETMLTYLEESQSKVVILDISGIPVVDTLVARHLITAASAVRLMGAECVITGIRAKIAQTLVQLGVDLGNFMTRTTLADGLQSALELTGQKIG